MVKNNTPSNLFTQCMKCHHNIYDIYMFLSLSLYIYMLFVELEVSYIYFKK